MYVWNPKGELIAEASAGEPELLVVDLHGKEFKLPGNLNRC